MSGSPAPIIDKVLSHPVGRAATRAALAVMRTAGGVVPNTPSAVLGLDANSRDPRNGWADHSGKHLWKSCRLVTSWVTWWAPGWPPGDGGQPSRRTAPRCCLGGGADIRMAPRRPETLKYQGLRTVAFERKRLDCCRWLKVQRR
jgi:hypothetical protein